MQYVNRKHTATTSVLYQTVLVKDIRSRFWRNDRNRTLLYFHLTHKPCHQVIPRQSRNIENRESLDSQFESTLDNFLDITLLF